MVNKGDPSFIYIGQGKSESESDSILRLCNGYQWIPKTMFKFEVMTKVHMESYRKFESYKIMQIILTVWKKIYGIQCVL